MYYVLLFSLHARSYAEVSSMTFPFPGLGYGNFFWENAQAHNLESYLILYQILCYLGGAGCTKEKEKSNLESSINDVSNEEGSNIDQICFKGFKERQMFKFKKWSSTLWMVQRPKIPTDSYLKD